MERRLVVLLAVRGLVVVLGIVVSIAAFADGDIFLGVLFAGLAVLNGGLVLYFLRRRTPQ